jgi:hypothetical protein
MKLLLIALVGLLIGGTANADARLPQECKVTVDTKLNVRSRPNGIVFATLAKDAIVYVENYDGDWLYVSPYTEMDMDGPTGSGWVLARFIKCVP